MTTKTCIYSIYQFLHFLSTSTYLAQLTGKWAFLPNPRTKITNIYKYYEHFPVSLQKTSGMYLLLCVLLKTTALHLNIILFSSFIFADNNRHPIHKNVRWLMDTYTVTGKTLLAAVMVIQVLKTICSQRPCRTHSSKFQATGRVNVMFISSWASLPLMTQTHPHRVSMFCKTKGA